jgi:hypothetical protein
MFEFFKKPKQEQVVERQENREEITRDSLLKRVWNNKYAYLIPVVLAATHVSTPEEHVYVINAKKKEMVMGMLEQYGYGSENYELGNKIPYEILEKLPSIEKIFRSKDRVASFLNDLGQGSNAESFLKNFDTKTEDRLVFLSSDFDIPLYFLLDTNPELIKNTLFDSRLDAFIEVTKSKKGGHNKYYKLDLVEFLILSNQDKDILQDPDFIQGARIAKEFDMSIDGNHQQLKFVGEIFEKNPNIANQVKILKQKFDISISMSVLKGMSNQEKIDFVHNRQLLELFHGKTITAPWSFNRIMDYQNTYQPLLQDPAWKESVKKLLQSGFGPDEILDVPYVVEKYTSQSFIDLVVQMKQSGYWFYMRQFMQGLHRPNHSISGAYVQSSTIFEDYRLDTEQGCEAFLSDLRELKKMNPYYDFFPESFVDDVKKIPIIKNIYSDIDNLNPEQEKASFLQDPALQYVMDLGYDKQVPDFLQILPETERKEWILRTARNMHAEGIPATENNFKEYLTQTILLRSNPEFINMNVFEGRNVLALAHNGQGENDKEVDWYQDQRFLNDTSQNVIKSQNPSSLEVFIGDTDKENLLKMKSDFLETVSTTKNITIFFDGHGGEDNIYLSDGGIDKDGNVEDYESSVSISTSELSDALLKQSKLDDGSRTILINHACFSQNFVRTLYEKLEEAGVEKLPIMIGMSEYGQYGYSDVYSVFNKSFFEGMLKESSGATKIQDIINLEQKNSQVYKMPFNISIFFPIKNQSNSKKGEIHWQIAEAEYLKNKTDENNPVT